MCIENKTTQDTVTKLATSQPPQPKQQQQNGTAVCKPLTWSFLSMSMKWSRVFSWADISGSNVPTLMKRSTPQLFRALVAHITEETRLETDTCIYIYIYTLYHYATVFIYVSRETTATGRKVLGQILQITCLVFMEIHKSVIQKLS